MKCPFCGHQGCRVIASRPVDGGAGIRRQRECPHCQNRFSTYETAESVTQTSFQLVKRDGTRQAYDRQKLLNGLSKACENRPVPSAQMEQIADIIEQKVSCSPTHEVSSKTVSEWVMEQLRPVDEIAYVRFASVYHQFKEIQE